MPGVPQDERDMLVERAPQVFYFTDHYRDYPMVLIRLSKAQTHGCRATAAAALADAGVEGGDARHLTATHNGAGRTLRRCMNLIDY